MMKKFSFQLLSGSFGKEEALDILTRMVDVKIKYHENKIMSSDNAEDVKMREKRIKQLQKDLFEARKTIESKKERIELNSEISLQL